MTEPIRITLTIPTPQEGWRFLKLVQEYGTPDEYDRLRDFIGNSLPAEAADTPIEELDFGVRTYNVIKRMGIDTVGQLVGYSEAALRQNTLVNDATVGELRRTLLHNYGIGLAGDAKRHKPDSDET